MNQSSTAVLLLGDALAPEMLPAAEFVRGRGDLDVRTSQGVVELQRLMVAEEWYPDLIVALQFWPEQFSGNDVRRLLPLAPLARIVCVCGAWCDSEGRTHPHWPLAVRAPVPTAIDRIRRELAAIRGETAALPLTAARGEIFAADMKFALQAPPRSMQVAVESPDRCYEQMLSAALVRGGHQVVGLENSPPPAAILWDSDPWDNVRLAELRSLRSAHSKATIVACTGFYRDDQASAIHGAGADAVWSKLAPLTMLLSKVQAAAAVS